MTYVHHYHMIQRATDDEPIRMACWVASLNCPFSQTEPRELGAWMDYTDGYTVKDDTSFAEWLETFRKVKAMRNDWREWPQPKSITETRITVGLNDNNVTFENARLVYRNFEGKEGRYNKSGDRNFSVVLSDQEAEDMIRAGWNVKRKEPRDEGDGKFNTLDVTVEYSKGRPPRITLITSKGQTFLDEDTCMLLDWADIKICDLIVRPYSWAVNGNTGIKAYLHMIYVTVNENALELKYADVPEANGQRPAAEQREDYIPEPSDESRRRNNGMD